MRPIGTALTVGAAALLLLAGPAVRSGSAAEEAASFRWLRAGEIRARVVGRDITDDFHWTEYYRPDGALVVTDMGRPRTGRWAIRGDRLCTARERGAGFECFEVWVSGDEVSLRQDAADRPFTAYIRRHGR